MFDNFLNAVRTQTALISEQLSASLSDLQSKRVGAGVRSPSFVDLKKQLRGQNQCGLIPKSRSTLGVDAKTELKWPVLVGNERQWVSSSSLYAAGHPNEMADSSSGDSEDDCGAETVFNNPAHRLQEGESEEEESLVDRFDRVLARVGPGKQRRNDREEIRRRLAMGVESEEIPDIDKLARKPSLHSRLQSGMNLQICFMNETASDGSDSENPRESSAEPTVKTELLSKMKQAPDRDSFKSLPPLTGRSTQPPAAKTPAPSAEQDFFTHQVKLQVEARAALAQAKELARLQMQVERQQKKQSLISDLVRQSLEKLGLPFTRDCRRLSRQILTELSVAQLQVIVNDLHTQIEGLNEELVQMLLKRDDFHMEQDSMLVDIEDLTRYLTAKQSIMNPLNRAEAPASLPPLSKASASPKQRLRSLRIPGLHK